MGEVQNFSPPPLWELSKICRLPFSRLLISFAPPCYFPSAQPIDNEASLIKAIFIRAVPFSMVWGGRAASQFKTPPPPTWIFCFEKIGTPHPQPRFFNQFFWDKMKYDPPLHFIIFSITRTSRNVNLCFLWRDICKRKLKFIIAQPHLHISRQNLLSLIDFGTPLPLFFWIFIGFYSKT